MNRHINNATPRRFPILVCTICGIAALALFFASTVPAIAQQSQLDQLEADRLEMLQSLIEQNGQWTNTMASLQHDPQTVLVEIDKLGLTPEELLDQQGFCFSTLSIKCGPVFGKLQLFFLKL